MTEAHCCGRENYVQKEIAMDSTNISQLLLETADRVKEYLRDSINGKFYAGKAAKELRDKGITNEEFVQFCDLIAEKPDIVNRWIKLFESPQAQKCIGKITSWASLEESARLKEPEFEVFYEENIEHAEGPV